MTIIRSLPIPFLYLIFPCLVSAVLLTGCDIQINGGYSFSKTGETATEEDGSEIAETVKSVRVEHKFGNVKVSRVADGESPSWNWKGKVWCDTQELADELIQQLVIEVKTEGEQQTFVLLMPESQSGFNGSESNLELKIRDDTSIDISNDHGDLAVADVGQNAKLAGSFGEIQARNIEGNLTLDAKHCDVQIKGVNGTTDAETSFGDMTVDALQGMAKLENSHGSIEGTVNGPAEVESSFEDIKLTCHGPTIQIENAHSDIDLVIASQDFKTVDVKNKHGDVTIDLPAETAANIDMDTSFGDAKSKIDSDTSSDRKITVKNSHGDIDIK